MDGGPSPRRATPQQARSDARPGDWRELRVAHTSVAEARWDAPCAGCPVRAESASSLSAGTYGAQHFRQRAPLGRTIRDREALGARAARLGPGPSRFR